VIAEKLVTENRRDVTAEAAVENDKMNEKRD